jgi:hypothetical protein
LELDHLSLYPATELKTVAFGSQDEGESSDDSQDSDSESNEDAHVYRLRSHSDEA